MFREAVNLLPAPPESQIAGRPHIEPPEPVHEEHVDRPRTDSPQCVELTGNDVVVVDEME